MYPINQTILRMALGFAWKGRDHQKWWQRRPAEYAIHDNQRVRAMNAARPDYDSLEHVYQVYQDNTEWSVDARWPWAHVKWPMHQVGHGDPFKANKPQDQHTVCITYKPTGYRDQWVAIRARVKTANGTKAGIKIRHYSDATGHKAVIKVNGTHGPSLEGKISERAVTGFMATHRAMPVMAVKGRGKRRVGWRWVATEDQGRLAA